MKIIFSLVIAVAIKSVIEVKIKEQKDLREINKRDELKEMTNRVAKEIEKNRRNKERKIDEDRSKIKEKKGNCNENKEEIMICDGNSCISQRIDLIDKKKLQEIIMVNNGKVVNNKTLSNNNNSTNSTFNDKSNNTHQTHKLNNNNLINDNNTLLNSFEPKPKMNQLLNKQKNSTNGDSRSIVNKTHSNPLLNQSLSKHQLSIPPNSSKSNTTPMNLSNKVTIVNSQKANSKNNSKKISLSPTYNYPTKTITNINIEIS